MRYFKNFSLSVLLCLGLGLGQSLIFAPAVEAWGGVGSYGSGGYGYGRLLRMGSRGAYGYGNRNRYNNNYNRYGQSGQFSHNHNRVNGFSGAQSGYGYGSGSGSGSNSGFNQGGLYGRAQGRFERQHSNNQLWNGGGQGGQGNAGANLWGSNSGSHPYYWGQSGGGMVRGGYGYGGR